MPHPARGLAGSLLRLQRTAGNQAVAGLLVTSRPELQAKLRIDHAGDAFEREAERVADAMVGTTAPRAGLPAISQFHGGLGGTVHRCPRCGGDRGGRESGETPGSAAPGMVQRKCQCGSGKDDETMQRREVPGGAPRVPAGFAAQVAGLRGGGAPLSPALRGFFEPRFGHDFGAVRVHSGPLAERSAEAVRARAFTLGNDVVFGRGEYAPDSPAGRHLLAHELTHVVQQTPMVVRRQPLMPGLGDEGRLPGRESPEFERHHGSTLPHRQATELQTCLRIMGEANADYCRHVVLGEKERCSHPGVARTLNLQPVFLRTSATDPSPTGATWATRLSTANTIWGKLGVTFNGLAAITMTTPLKTSSAASPADYLAVAGLRSGAGVEVFLVDNDMNARGGAGTLAGCDAGGKIVMSDRGTSATLLAHELGHTLGLKHPQPDGPHAGAPGTIMEPSRSNSTANPTLNTMENYNRIQCPASTVPKCLHPDRAPAPAAPPPAPAPAAPPPAPAQPAVPRGAPTPAP